MKKLTMSIGFILSSFLLHAQKNYAVMVTDSKTGNAISGVSIKIMSTGKVTATSESGNVVMLISPDDSLLITSKGYKDRKLQMAGQFIALSIILDPVPEKDKIIPKPKKKKTLKPRKSQVIMLKEKSKVVTNNRDNPARKNISAIFSSLPLFLIEPFIDKKERIQLAINMMIASVVNSSIIVLPAMFNNLSDVSTTKQSPNKLEDAFKI